MEESKRRLLELERMIANPDFDIGEFTKGIRAIQSMEKALSPTKANRANKNISSTV